MNRVLLAPPAVKAMLALSVLGMLDGECVVAAVRCGGGLPASVGDPADFIDKQLLGVQQVTGY